MEEKHNSVFRNPIFSLIFISMILASGEADGARALSRWFTHTQADGTLLTLKLVGDEHSHYYISSDGTEMTKLEGGDFEELSSDQISQNKQIREERLGNIAKKRTSASKTNLSKSRTSSSSSEVKKGLVILMQFTDQSFRDDYAYDDWYALLNEDGYSYNDAPGCVSEYFSQQSDGQFEIEFDVFGPYTASNTYAYYGQNNPRNSSDIDINVCYLVAEACDSVKGLTDFTQYDWDGDGEVDQVFILYAGEGENVSGNSEDLIWPHEYYLQYYSAYYRTGGYEVEDGIIINQYACGAEILWDNELSGLGTFCHEFSHCLGLPDFYTDEGVDSFGEYDILGEGNYNNEGWCPPNYTAYEKMFCGWYDPIELTEPITISGLETMENGGEAYIIRNESDDEDADEYYILENRQQTGWDAYIPGSGLIITHYDYDEYYWAMNNMNDDSDHPRAVIIPANDDYDTPKGYAYPYASTIMFGVATNVNDSLTDNSSPAAIVYNKPSSYASESKSYAPPGGPSTKTTTTYYMGKPVTEITDSDGLVGFSFMGGDEASGIKAALADNSSLDDLQGKTVKICDISGKLITIIQEFQGTGSLALPPGIYLIEGVKVRL